MFVQVFHGRLNSPDLWSSQVEKWRRDIRPKTTGFLGFTTGVTADDYMITVARFESQDKARADSDLPEQGAWFEETSKAFDGELTFHDCPQVDVVLAGGSDAAGFVQVMRGRAKDRTVMRDLLAGMEDELQRTRPDLIGATVGWDGDGGFVQTSYFTSEQEARVNEQTMAASPAFDKLMDQMDGPITYYDLSRPQFA
jgi:hypothetical protein